MAANGINAVRTYTVPPRWLLDAALRHGLRVMVGLPWEQHVAFLDDRPGAALDRASACASGVRACAGHPAVLCYAVGNEIPAPIVRWHGRRRVERFLERLCTRRARRRTPTRSSRTSTIRAPSTSACRSSTSSRFNVYLERPTRARAATWHGCRTSRASGRSLLAEIGAGQPPQRRGRARRTRSAGSSAPRSAAAAPARSSSPGRTSGTAAATRSRDWDFGLTDRDRRPKPALAARRGTLRGGAVAAASGRGRASRWSSARHNGARTIARLPRRRSPRCDYPDYEVDRRRRRLDRRDGGDRGASSTSALIRTENRGLSAARNAGLAAATRRDRRLHRRRRLARSATGCTTSSSAFDDDRPRRRRRPEPAAGRTTARSPPASRTPRAGRSTSCCSDTEAEHIPGCNMAFRREALLEIGGFDPQFRAAGDDVDVCWRLAGARRHARLPRRRQSSGITGATRSAATGASSAATAARRRCSSASGPRSTTRRGHLTLGRAALRPRERARFRPLPRSTTAPGAPAPSSRERTVRRGLARPRR